MPLDSKKFIATADGTSIRLFPENYGVIYRPTVTTKWQLDLDAAIGIDLAAAIFELYHSNHDFRWGTKDKVLRDLKALLKEDKPDPGFTTDWELEEEIGGYHLWVRYCDGRELYQCTIAQNPPQTEAGYCNRSALLKLKGIIK